MGFRRILCLAYRELGFWGSKFFCVDFLYFDCFVTFCRVLCVYICICLFVYEVFLEVFWLECLLCFFVLTGV